MGPTVTNVTLRKLRVDQKRISISKCSGHRQKRQATSILRFKPIQCPPRANPQCPTSQKSCSTPGLTQRHLKLPTSLYPTQVANHRRPRRLRHQGLIRFQMSFFSPTANDATPKYQVMILSAPTWRRFANK